MHKIDDSFRRKKEADARGRRRRRLKFRLLLGAFAVFLVFASSAALWFTLGPAPQSSAPSATRDDAAEMPAFAPTIIDLAGDPLRIELGAGGMQSATIMQPVPDDLKGFGFSGEIGVLHEKILPSSQRLVTAIPSTPQDFAFFQAQRAGTAQAQPESQPQAAPAIGTRPSDAQAVGANVAVGLPSGVTGTKEGGGWSDIAVADLEGSGADFKKTAVENNVSTIVLVSESVRASRTEDDFRRVIAASPPTTFLQANGMAEAEAQKVSRQLKAYGGLETLPAGSIVAMRYVFDRSAQSPRRLVQLAVYEPEKFLGALAADDTGNFVAAADPWVSQNLFRLLEEPKENVEQKRYRLLDGIYSVGLRNGIPSSIIGEAIMHLSRGHDLGEFATQEDNLTLLYSEEGREDSASQSRVLYVGIDGPNSTIHCFIFKPADANSFSCLDENDRSRTIEVTNGMVTPVAGVMTSTFGPRRHPILHTVLMHEGVDWAAPVGTAVRAAYPGTIAVAAESGSYGNFVKIEHAGGRSTGYAHLSAFAPALAAGKIVKAGDLIGYVGTTGRSTGPHLHFELYVAGKPINPLQNAIASNDSGGEAVEALVEQIVRVESGGNAEAKNPLSSATGLGQFIDSTWMRMMQTYRPDLARSLERDKLLALRLDPTLSREMVANLARENKSYLENGGQSITAGRLYLAHFLGPEGARTVLAAVETDPLDKVLGNTVIQANPFLAGKDVAYVKNWAEQKMNRRGGAVPVTVTRKIEEASPEFLKYRSGVLGLLGGEAG